MKTKRKNKVLSILLGAATCLTVGGFALFSDNETSVSASEIALDGFEIRATAEVRMKGTAGIRFTVDVDEDTADKAAKLNNPTYGTLLLPKDLLGDDEELTFGSLSVMNIKATTWQDEDTYTSALLGKKNADGTYQDLPESYYNRPIAARGYVTGTDDDGNTVTYYTSNVAVRSIGYVAAMATANGETSDLLTAIAGKTSVELVWNDEVNLALDTDADNLLYNGYGTDKTDALAVLMVGGVPVSSSSLKVEYTVGSSDVLSVDGETVKVAGSGETTVTAECAFNGTTYTLADDNAITVDTSTFVAKSDYVILLPASATSQESKAASEFQTLFKESTGIKLPIKTETGSETTAGKYLSIGETALAKANVTLSVTKETASQIQTTDNTVFVRGLGDLGTRYGVQQLLGDLVGYEYYQMNTYALNLVKSIIEKPEDTSYVPAIEYNTLDRNSDVNENYGMQLSSDGLVVNWDASTSAWMHNSTVIISPDTYSTGNSTYKEWFATDYILLGVYKYYGKDVFTVATDPYELCYTAHGNSTAYEALVSEVANKIVSALQYNPTLNKIGFSATDHNNWCTCDGCSDGGNASDNLIAFLNDVVAKVESGLTSAGDGRADSFKIVTLAYHATNVAPSTETPDDHIEVWFGESHADYVVALNDSSSTKNAEVYTNLTGWVDKVGTADLRLWVYYSNTKCGFVPYNSFDAMRENYKIADTLGVDYILNQTIQARSSWTMLKLYLASQLAWNAQPTDTEWNAWIDDYFENAYGNGAEYMRTWFNAWSATSTDAYLTSDDDPSIHKDMLSDSSAFGDSGAITSAMISTWIGYADNALKALDPNDANYQSHYDNILLEKASLQYLQYALTGSMDNTAQFVYACNTWSISTVSEKANLDADTTLTNIINGVTTETVEDRYYVTVDNGTGSVTLTSDNLVANETYTVTINGTAYSATVTTAGEITVSGVRDLTAGNDVSIVLTKSDSSKIITYTDVVAKATSSLTVTTPSDSNYYIFEGASIVEASGDYTFTVTATNGELNDFIVLVNGEEVTGINGQYTVENVTEDLTIQVLHGYIEHIDAVTVNYNMDGSAVITNTYGVSQAYISAEYIEYMISKGYTQILFDYVADGSVAIQAVARYNGNIVAYNISTKATTITVNLVEGANSALEFWAQDADGKGYTLAGKGGYLTVGAMVMINVSTSDYYTVSGEYDAESGEYTFSVTETVEGLDDFVVYANGKNVTGTLHNGEYTATGIGKALTIEVLHGYIEAFGATDRNTSVAYNDDGSITITNAVFLADSTRAHGDAYISAEYIEYMISQGYKKLTFTYVADGTTAATAVYRYNNSLVTCTTETAVTIDLVSGGGELELVGWNANNSGYAIMNKGGYVTVKNLTFHKTENVYWNETVYADSTDKTVKLESVYFAKGDTYTVTVNGESVEATVTTNGQLDVAFSSTLTVGSTYSVVAKGDSYIVNYSKVTAVTKIITQASELSLLAFSNADNQTSGYYVLGCDIDASGVKCASGNYTWNQGFAGAFDGCGYTIYNLEAGIGGIFGQIYGGTIKNVNFVDVVINDTNNYVSLFSSLNDKVTVTDVNVSFKSVTVSSTSTHDTGLLFSRQLGNSTITNVTIDASGIDVVSVFGAQCSSTTFTNVTVYANSITELYNTATGPNKTTSTAVTSVAGVTVEYVKGYAVMVPADSDYFVFDGKTMVIEGNDYTFSVTATKDGLDDFIVLVNGEEVTLVNGEYTVENVTEDLTIEVLHGYIEHIDAVTVNYNMDGSAVITNTYGVSQAYISAEYIEYMISKGYTQIIFDYVADGSVAIQAVARYNENIVAYNTSTTASRITVNLVEGANSALEFWAQDADGKGYTLAGLGGYVTITGLTFVK